MPTAARTTHDSSSRRTLGRSLWFGPPPVCLSLFQRESPESLAASTAKRQGCTCTRVHVDLNLNTMSIFAGNVDQMEGLLAKAKKVSKGSTLAEAKIDSAWLVAYAQIARRCRDDKEFGLSRYPYEQGPSVRAFTGGFFEHREWPLRKGLERHNSLRLVSEYEANYVNASG